MTVFYACTFDVEPSLDDFNLSVELHWTPGLLMNDQSNLETGISWTMSSLGASLPRGSLSRGLVWQNENVFVLNFKEMGFSQNALRAIRRILRELKESEEFIENGHLELGRLMTLMLNSSFHYYEITQAPKTIAEFRSLYRFNDKRVTVVNSTISTSHRLLEVADADVYAQIAHIGSESGEDFLPNKRFEPTEFEVLDLMPNGQLRYAIYGEDGRLKPFANENLTAAGRPTKCMWCHEVVIQPFFSTNAVLDTDSTLTQDEFLEIRGIQMGWVTDYRLQLDSDLDFNNTGDHQFMEWIYEDFLEPDAAYLATEWGLRLDQVATILAALVPHSRNGIPGYYHRKDVDSLAPFGSVRVPESGRERSDYEPNFF